MEELLLDFFDFHDFQESDFEEAISDLKEFGVNEDELNLDYYEIE